jgi:hypothetical protein
MELLAVLLITVFVGTSIAVLLTAFTVEDWS